MKTCSKCKEIKPLDAFYVRKPTGYYPVCKSCKAIEGKKFRDLPENIDVIRERRKSYRQKPQAILKKREANKRYNKTLSAKKSQNNYRKKRCAIDPIYKLKIRIRNNISQSISRLGYTKKSKIEIILGCDYEHFKLYIEKQFKSGMSWENYGDWHIDHKVPISWAKTENEVLNLNHYQNLQPLWAFENISKSNKYAS